MLWEVDIYPADGQPDRRSVAIAADAKDLGLASDLAVSRRDWVLDSRTLAFAKTRPVRRDNYWPTGCRAVCGRGSGASRFSRNSQQGTALPGCPDDMLEAGFRTARESQVPAQAARPRPFQAGRYGPGGSEHASRESRLRLAGRRCAEAAQVLVRPSTSARFGRFAVLRRANDAIEQVIAGPLPFRSLELGSEYHFRLLTVPLNAMDDAALEKLSREGQLYLSLAEMQTIQAHFRQLGRDSTDAELETLAQTWSEHCSHKTLAGRISYRGPEGQRQFQNMLRETIFAATQQIRRSLVERGAEDWCASVFEDNAGVVHFDENYHVVFKSYAHPPRALEPYGGANTGIGGVIRDPLGTGLGAKPICNTDVFCFAPPDTPADAIPPGVLHPRRVMKGVVAGVRDYGNRMGIPTVNGAIYFDPRYLGNPLVYCGNVGLLPRDKVRKQPQAGDRIVVDSASNWRGDGIHGATFSLQPSRLQPTGNTLRRSGRSATRSRRRWCSTWFPPLAQSHQGSWAARSPIAALAACRLWRLARMGEKIGRGRGSTECRLAHQGLCRTPRFGFRRPRNGWCWPCRRRTGPTAAALWLRKEASKLSDGGSGEYVPTGRLQLKYAPGTMWPICPMAGAPLTATRPDPERGGICPPPQSPPLEWPELLAQTRHFTPHLLRILGSLNVCSKEWVIRQYDHEVQGGSVVKPLVGAANDGPSDAAVVRPVLASRRGIAVSCGMNPRFGDFDTYHMAASAIDEAVRNCVAIGADPARVAILDNFCWGDCNKPETLGSLVRAAIACHDVAVALGTPFISGKDSLNNEFRYTDAAGVKQTIAVPPSLLISALGQINDVSRAVTMDLKTAGNVLYQVGATKDELGGSHFALAESLAGGQVPKVNPPLAKATFSALHRAIELGLVRACHDLSEGGLAAAAAEMALAGGLGARVFLEQVPHHLDATKHADAATYRNIALLFAESNTRFLCEVPPDAAEAFEEIMGDVPVAAVGEVLTEPQLQIVSADAANPLNVIDVPIGELKEAWQAPLRW